MGFFYVVSGVVTDLTQIAETYIACLEVVVPKGLESEYGLENQLDITKKAPVVQIIQVDFHLVRPNDIVVISLWIGLLGEQFFLITIFDTGWTRNAWAELENTTVITFQLVGIARHVGAWTDETHLSDKNINQLGKAIHLAMPQPMAHARDAGVVGCGDRIAFRLMMHSSELTDSEWLAVLSNAFLHKKHWSF